MMKSEQTEARLNPFSEEFDRINETVARLAETKKEIDGELRWYDSTDREKLGEELRVRVADAEQLNRDLKGAESELAAIQQRINNSAASIGTLFNPLNWFSADQVSRRRIQENQIKSGETQKTKQQDICNRLSNIRNEIESIEAAITRYNSFNVEGRQGELRELQLQIASKRKESDRIAERKARVDQALAPLIREMRVLASSRRDAEGRKQRATRLDNELSRADNSYERAMIHEKCESEFGVRSPRKVVNQQEQEIRRIERDYTKTEERAKEIGQKASRQIDTLVIDGNNLCYEDNRFIGLSALESLVPMLKRDYAITIVFDSAIRRMLKTDDVGIRNRFGEDVQVHVVATKNMADETVLDLAARSARTFVLSNDRFADYNEKAAVREMRILRHEIVDGQVFVHDLNIRLSYR